MSDAISRRAALLGLLALGGCGFVPVYGDSASLRGLVSFETPDTVAGFRLHEQLETRLGLAQTPRYALQVSLSFSQSAAAITSDGDTVRFNVVGDADWRLRDLTTGALLETGRSESFTSYSATGSTVATQAATTAANARLSVTLADMIVSRLLVLKLDPNQ